MIEIKHRETGELLLQLDRVDEAKAHLEKSLESKRSKFK